jgi:formylglycine-generating enzyme required for sulfatase activity
MNTKHFLRALIAILSLAVSVEARAQCAGDMNGDGVVNGADLGMLLSSWGYCPATITNVTPLQGGTQGGTVISITGTGVASTSSVMVGGNACTNVSVISPTLVRATTPPGASGQASIAVTTNGGTTLASTPFNYVQQQITSIVPFYGPYAGGTPITITGQFLAGTTVVTIGGVPCTNVVSVSATQVTAVTPAGSLGAMDVVVNCPKGAVTAQGGFTYLSVIVPAWATLIEAAPDPEVVTNPTLRAAIAASGYAWRVRDNGTGIEMLLIPQGTFTMGCIMGSNLFGCYSREQPVHDVTLTNRFYLGRYETTQQQWTTKMGLNPSYFQGYADSANRPVEQVSWTAIQGYLSATGMRLPTEAEWEYACRAGTSTPFYNGSTDDATLPSLAQCSSNSGGQSRPVGGKAANGFGLHDMLGNVWEWVNDWQGGYPATAQTNPTGPASGVYRQFRGAAWPHGSDVQRSSNRTGGIPGYIAGDVGFRVARNP